MLTMNFVTYKLLLANPPFLEGPWQDVKSDPEPEKEALTKTTSEIGSPLSFTPTLELT